MSNSDLKQLEQNVHALIRQNQQLKAENQYLREKQNNILKQRHDLQEKNQQALDKVQGLLKQLRTETIYDD